MDSSIHLVLRRLGNNKLELVQMSFEGHILRGEEMSHKDKPQIVEGRQFAGVPVVIEIWGH